MQTTLSRPAKVIFQPTALEIKFEKSLKLQMALFRTATDDKGKRAVKMDKTEPMKFTSPTPQISFSNTLSLLTTLPYNSSTKTYENKTVEFEMALDVDGNKTRMSKKINLKDAVNSKGASGKFSMDNPAILLHYKMEVKVQGSEPKSESPERSKNQSPMEKKIKFKDDYLSAGCKQEVKENFKGDPDLIRSERSTDRGRHKTLAPECCNIESQSRQQLRSQNEVRIKKCKSLSRPQEQSFNIIKALKNIERQENCSVQSKKRTDEYQLKYNQLITNYRELENKLKEKDSKIVELSIKIQELELKVAMGLKSEKSTKDLMKKEQTAKINYEGQIASLKEEIKTYKAEIQKLSRTALTYQESTKNMAVGNEQEVKALKDRIRALERTNQESAKQGEYYENSIKDKDQIIADLKSKIYSLDKNNLELQCSIKNLEGKLGKIKQEHANEIAQLEEHLTEMKEDNKNIRLTSAKDIKEDGGDLRKKVEALEKQLEKKQELLKKMNELKKEADFERTNENANLRKEIADLKEVIDRMESKQMEELSSTTSIEYRVQMERMKKELQLLKKSEKGLLIEKNRLESSNHALQDEVVKQKMIIAGILNVVQQTGDERLISEAYSLTQ